ncbi:MAG: IS200/IS605-like element ISAzo20 family transposase [Treponemataceae bacterium]|nr:MAG: IS200/IS605-like element ISAzo20 family transposase [Treponemataceae bacterium]
MKDWQSLAHTKRECKYHAVLVPKYRKKVLYGRVRKQIGAILRELCRYKGIEILEARAMPDHIHMCISVPPKFSIAMAIGYLKGKSAIRIHKEPAGRELKGFTNKNFWARGVLCKHGRAGREDGPGVHTKPGNPRQGFAGFS